MQVPRTIVDPKAQAPTSPPTPMKIPSDSPPAVIDDTMSGAPFANASSVLPAIASLNLNSKHLILLPYLKKAEILVKTGVRYLSAT